MLSYLAFGFGRYKTRKLSDRGLYTSSALLARLDGGLTEAGPQFRQFFQFIFLQGQAGGPQHGQHEILFICLGRSLY